jgi:WD repeat-containing protein 19
LGDIKKPVKIAIAIAEDDMQKGQYKTAHKLLFQTYKRLLDNGHRSTLQLHTRLLILHTYMIVRKLIKLKEHERAARMLNRVCSNISQFP